jgi:hypothetical protein
MWFVIILAILFGFIAIGTIAGLVLTFTGSND